MITLHSIEKELTLTSDEISAMCNLNSLGYDTFRKNFTFRGSFYGNYWDVRAINTEIWLENVNLASWIPNPRIALPAFNPLWIYSARTEGV